MGCHFLLQETFPTQGLNLGLPHCGQTLYHLSHQGSSTLKSNILLESTCCCLVAQSLRGVGRNMDGCDLFFFGCTARLLGESHGTLLQYSCLENPMDRGASKHQCKLLIIIYIYILIMYIYIYISSPRLLCLQHWQACTLGIPRGTSGKEPAYQCRKHKRCGFDPWVGKISLEEGMATHSSSLAWRLPCLVSYGAWGCKSPQTHDLATKPALAQSDIFLIIFIFLLSLS